MFCEWKPNKTRLSIQDKWKHIYSHVVISARRHLYFCLTLHRVRVELDLNSGSNSCCLRWTLVTRDETRVRGENAQSDGDKNIVRLISLSPIRFWKKILMYILSILSASITHPHIHKHILKGLCSELASSRHIALLNQWNISILTNEICNLHIRSDNIDLHVLFFGWLNYFARHLENRLCTYTRINSYYC